jgi:glutamate racemase
VRLSFPDMLGIFDSGIGGLTVVKELLRRQPDADFIYLGDRARAPYGSKTADVIARYAVEDAQFLISQGADVLVVACNSMSAYAMDALKAAFPSIPLFEVIGPGARAAAAVTKGRVGVIGTHATKKSGAYERLINDVRAKTDVQTVSCPLFVPLLEEGVLNPRETKLIIKRYLAPLRTSQIDTLVLGCTHYPLLREWIEPRIGHRVTIVDPSSTIVDEMTERGVIKSGSGRQSYFFTDDNPRTRELAEAWLKRPVNIEKATI